MRIGSTLDALEFLAADMQAMGRRERLTAYATMQVLVERLGAIARSAGLSASLINAQLLKVQYSAEALAGLGAGRIGEDQLLRELRAALAALAGLDCFGYHLDEVE